MSLGWTALLWLVGAAWPGLVTLAALIIERRRKSNEDD